MKKQKFHSSYVIDVSVLETEIVLVDSNHCRWQIDAKDAETVAQFKTWFKTVFARGVPQTLTVFEYEDRGSDSDFDFYIVKFLNLDQHSENAEKLQ